jgi:hypothetical protein
MSVSIGGESWFRAWLRVSGVYSNTDSYRFSNNLRPALITHSGYRADQPDGHWGPRMIWDGDWRR